MRVWNELSVTSVVLATAYCLLLQIPSVWFCYCLCHCICCVSSLQISDSSIRIPFVTCVRWKICSWCMAWNMGHHTHIQHPTSTPYYSARHYLFRISISSFLSLVHVFISSFGRGTICGQHKRTHSHRARAEELRSESDRTRYRMTERWEKKILVRHGPLFQCGRSHRQLYSRIVHNRTSL